MRPKRIAYIIDTIGAPTGGTEKQLLYLLNGLDRSLIEPHLFCFYPSKWMSSQTFSFPVTYLNIRRIYGPDLFSGTKIFKSIHKEKQFDIAQTFFKEGNIFGTFAAHRAKISTIISSRRNVGYWHDKVQLSILRFLSKWTTHYLANSQAAIELTAEMEHVDKSKFSLIYNGLDLEKFKQIDQHMRKTQRDRWNLKETDIVLGVVANLRPVKRHDKVIDAAKVLIEKNKNLKFVFVGEGTDREKLENQISQLQLEKHFLLPGSVTDIVPVLSAFDIAILPSSNESFSNSLIEYMAAGLPIAATAVGGNIEAITHGENGYLYDIDDEKGLVDIVNEILDNVDKSDKLAQTAKKNAFDEYSIEKMIENHHNFYCSL